LGFKPHAALAKDATTRADMLKVDKIFPKTENGADIFYTKANGVAAAVVRAIRCAYKSGAIETAS